MSAASVRRPSSSPAPRRNSAPLVIPPPDVNDPQLLFVPAVLLDEYFEDVEEEDEQIIPNNNNNNNYAINHTENYQPPNISYESQVSNLMDIYEEEMEIEPDVPLLIAPSTPMSVPNTFRSGYSTPKLPNGRIICLKKRD